MRQVRTPRFTRNLLDLGDLAAREFGGPAADTSCSRVENLQRDRLLAAYERIGHNLESILLFCLVNQ
jgi:hypothetical protein